LLDKNRINKHYNLSKFDFVWLSFELGCRKPDEKIYKIVEEQCKISIKNILFIDDTLANIETAKQIGWNVCLATGLEFDKIKESVYKFLEIEEKI
jgi:HAD superfamily hydrolase (TIGR01509 family)